MFISDIWCWCYSLYQTYTKSQFQEMAAKEMLVICEIRLWYQHAYQLPTPWAVSYITNSLPEQRRSIILYKQDLQRQNNSKFSNPIINPNILWNGKIQFQFQFLQTIFEEAIELLESIPHLMTGPQVVGREDWEIGAQAPRRSYCFQLDNFQFSFIICLSFNILINNLILCKKSTYISSNN